MDPRSNFVSLLKDLEGSSQLTADSYDQLRVAGMLRLLLLDGLVDRINREFRLKIRYVIGMTLPPMPPDLDPGQVMYSSIPDAFDPESVPGFPLDPRSVSRDELLRSEIVIVEGAPYTVRDLIKHLAHIDGLVHSDDPDSEPDAAFASYRRHLQIGGTPAGLRELTAVGRVVHRALEPLRRALVAKYG